ncbi:MAG: hypothetical protein ABIK89_20295 [Planctomycetota bacterium]
MGGILSTLLFTAAVSHLSAGSTLAGPPERIAGLSFAPRAGVLRVMGGSGESGFPGAEAREASQVNLDRLSLEGRQYLSRLAALRERSHPSSATAKPADEVRRLLAEQAESIGPVAFFTRHPLTRPSAAGCMIHESVPERWACGIRVHDPARAEAAPKTIFQDPEGSIFDMSLSLDAATLFFSYKRRGEECWQIHEIGVDGRGFKKISRDPACHEVGPVELPDGDLVFVSTRRGGYLLSEAGPRSNLCVMKRDGSRVRSVSQNTLADFSPYLLPDGRVLFTRWEYVDRDVEYRLGLWTQKPDGRQFGLFFGNTIRDVGLFWQAKPVPGNEGLVVATVARPNGWPHGAIGLVGNRRGLETPREQGYAWLTDEFTDLGDPTIQTDGMSYHDVDDGRLLDLAVRDDAFRGHREQVDLSRAHELEARAGAWLDSVRWAYRDPFPASDYLFLVSYAGESPGRFGLYLLDLCGNRMLLYTDPQMGCYNPLLLRPRSVFATPVATGSEASTDDGQTDAWATVLIADVYRGLSGIRRGRAAEIQIMEQVPKSHEFSRRARDQSPVMGYGTYYAKRVWGRVPIEPDGSAYFEAPALKEIYLQVLERHCTRCHSGPNPDGGCDLSGDKTRFFNMAYDNLLGRSRSYRQHNLTTGRMLSQEAAKGRPLVHYYWLRRAPTGVNRPLEAGSYVSRIADYLTEAHCGEKIPAEDRQRIYTWIDANVPYYATYSASRPLSPGGRDLSTDVDTGRPAAWYAGQFRGVYTRRCAECHGEFPDPNDHENIWDGRYAWVNFTHPEWSPALSAHLSREAGGRGLGTERFAAETPLFSDRTDPDYVTMLEAIREGRRRMLARPRVDMAGRGR